MAIPFTTYSAQIGDGESLEFTRRSDDAIIGEMVFHVFVSGINGHSLALQFYCPTEATWVGTGDTALIVNGETGYSGIADVEYRVLCTGGTGDVTVRVVV